MEKKTPARKPTAIYWFYAHYALMILGAFAWPFLVLSVAVLIKGILALAKDDEAYHAR